MQSKGGYAQPARGKKEYYSEGYLSVVTNALGDILVRLTKSLQIKVTTELEYADVKKVITEEIEELCYIENEININTRFGTKEIKNKIKELKASNKIKAFNSAKSKMYPKSKNYNNIHSINPTDDKFDDNLASYQKDRFQEKDFDIYDEDDMTDAIDKYYSSPKSIIP